MPPTTGTKRVRVSKKNANARLKSSKAANRLQGKQIHRSFVYGSEATPFDPNNRPKNAPADHTHSWKVFVRGVNNEDISYWLKKVQFKLHDTYANSQRSIEEAPFEVEETGWGEFEIAIKFFFVPESTEKPQQVWHQLKLHPYGDDIEGKKERRETVKNICYEEVLFNDPVEQFYDVMTGGTGITKGKGAKGHKAAFRPIPTAELPERITKDNVYSREQESKELDRLAHARKTLDALIDEEKKLYLDNEVKLQALEKTEGRPLQKKK